MSRIELEIPESVYSRLEQTIISTVEKTLQRHVEKIQAEPQMLTRQETAAMLKVSLPYSPKSIMMYQNLRHYDKRTSN